MVYLGEKQPIAGEEKAFYCDLQGNFRLINFDIDGEEGMILYEKTNLSQLLKEMRKQQKLTQMEVAQAIGVTKLTVWKIEHKQIEPKITTVLAWLRVCNRDFYIRRRIDRELD